MRFTMPIETGVQIPTRILLKVIVSVVIAFLHLFFVH